MRTMGSVVGEGRGVDQDKELNLADRNEAMSEGGEENSSEMKHPEISRGGNGVVCMAKGKEKVVDGGSGGDDGEFDGGDEKFGKVGDEDAEEDEDEEQVEEGDGEDEEDVSDAVRPKLDEGFYEIEAVRRKRVRKGEVQYLIKWRDWPEAANTWEPVENLQSCSDVIEAFEERLSSGKGSHRRRKRKSGVIHAQIRRKQPRSSGNFTKRSGRVRNVGNSPATSAPTDDTCLADNPSSSEYNILAYNKQSYENDVAVSSEVQLNQDKDCDLDMKLTEFRGGLANDDKRTDNLMMVLSQVDNGKQFQEPGRGDNIETTPRNLPVTGSKKRKSGKVRRHIPDPDADNRPDEVFDPVPGQEGALVHENSRLPVFPASSHKITEIIKPLSYARPESSTVHDPVVTFLAKRSDGKDVLVDNKFMKAYYPQQLISFYEKNIRYNPIS